MKKHLCAAPECTGCLACLNVCPKHAIGVTEGFLGEILPTIDEDSVSIADFVTRYVHR